MTKANEPLTFQKIVKDMDNAGKIDWTQLLVSRPKHYKVLKDILKCHSEQCGFTHEICAECGHNVIHYGSCNNSFCPMCGTIRRQEWIDQYQKKYLVNEKYHHIVFTVPSELNELFLMDMKTMTSILFQAASDTLLAFGRDPKFLGGQMGFSCVLHTWGSNLSLHPHLHCIVCAGALTEDQKWVRPKKTTKTGGTYLFPVQAVAEKYRGRFMALLEDALDPKKKGRKLKRSDKTEKDREKDLKTSFSEKLSQCYKKDWNVEIREAYDNPAHVVEYLGRYVQRIAISNSRLVSYEDGIVTFSYKDYRHGGEKKLMQLEDKEFLRRFLMHVLPQGTCRIRHYGFIGNNQRKRKIGIVRKLTNTPDREKVPFNTRAFLKKLLGYPVDICRKCGGEIVKITDWEYRKFGFS